ncbi:hypothetical protein EDD16DRAFT_1559635 [Pisolithus croceorrhizus]|nr:hypothetical protein EDD16DRAFT_1559635 [Pisolithus croceorrhizus]
MSPPAYVACAVVVLNSAVNFVNGGENDGEVYQLEWTTAAPRVTGISKKRTTQPINKTLENMVLQWVRSTNVLILRAKGLYIAHGAVLQ